MLCSCKCCQDDEKALHDRSNSTRCRIYFGVVWAVIVAACIVGFVGASYVKAGIVNFGDNVQATVDSITGTVRQPFSLSFPSAVSSLP